MGGTRKKKRTKKKKYQKGGQPIYNMEIFGCYYLNKEIVFKNDSPDISRILFNYNDSIKESDVVYNQPHYVYICLIKEINIYIYLSEYLLKQNIHITVSSGYQFTFEKFLQDNSTNPDIILNISPKQSEIYLQNIIAE